MLVALTHAHDPASAEQVRALTFDNRLHVNEVPLLALGAVHDPENIAAGWAWFKDKFADILTRVPATDHGELVGIGRSFCTTTARDDYARFFHDRAKTLAGGPRLLATTLDEIDACIAVTDRNRAAAAQRFAASAR
jgi:hypothetical protein